MNHPLVTGSTAQPTTVSADVLVARAYLSRVAEPGCVPLWAAVRAHGPVAVADAVRTGDVPEDVHLATRARARTTDPHADLEAADRRGLRLLVPEGDGWPHIALAALERTGLARLQTWRTAGRADATSGELVPPLALWVRGPAPLETLSLRSVAVVGARSATSYGTHLAKELAYRLALRGVDVVSGGAVGIDAAAHRGALAAGGPTVIVSAGGADGAYPAGNRSLFDRVAEHGAVVSEVPPGAGPYRSRFLTRNRLVAAFGTGTLVVEAAWRSGALNTATHARGLERPVMAVPGPVTSAQSAGCHRLLAAETAPARLVTSADDVLALVGGVGDVPDPARSAALATDALDVVGRRVLDGFPARKPISVDRLAVRSGVPAVQLFGALATLRTHGLVVDDEHGQVRRVPPETGR